MTVWTLDPLTSGLEGCASVRQPGGAVQLQGTVYINSIRLHVSTSVCLDDNASLHYTEVATICEICRGRKFGGAR